MVRTALIGHSGFVGGNLLSQYSFTDLYNSRNIDQIREQKFDLLVCAGARAEKWKANQSPVADLENIQSLIRNLEGVTAREAILISTVDVYPSPILVDENTEIAAENHAYGKNRFLLEQFFKTEMKATIIRLPGLFGNGLKKNVIYDFLNANNVDRINLESVFQFYNLDWLWRDISRVRDNGIRLCNFATEPVRTAAVQQALCGDASVLVNPDIKSPSANYDFRSCHCSLWGRDDGYLYSRDEVLNAIAKYGMRVRSGRNETSHI